MQTTLFIVKNVWKWFFSRPEGRRSDLDGVASLIFARGWITQAFSADSPPRFGGGKVTEIKKESGGVKRVTVGYVSPFQESGAFDPNAQPDPVKYQDYLFKKNGSDYYLYAIVESQAKVQTAQSDSTAQGGQDTVQQGTLESMLGDSLPTVESTSLAVSEQPAA